MLLLNLNNINRFFLKIIFLILKHKNTLKWKLVTGTKVNNWTLLFSIFFLAFLQPGCFSKVLSWVVFKTETGFLSDRSIPTPTRSKKFNIFCFTFYVGIALTRRWRLLTNKRKDIEKDWDKERQRDRQRERDKDKERKEEKYTGYRKWLLDKDRENDM